MNTYYLKKFRKKYAVVSEGFKFHLLNIQTRTYVNTYGDMHNLLFDWMILEVGISTAVKYNSRYKKRRNKLKYIELKST